MQNQFRGKLCLGLAASIALNAFSTTATAGFVCHIYKANITLKNGAATYGLFNVISFDGPYSSGAEILDHMKRDQVTMLTIYRKLQTVRYPKEQILAVARTDIVEVRTSTIRTIEYLSRMECAPENVPHEILELPQEAIDLLQKTPLALVEIPTSDISSEVCLSYNRHAGKPELRRVCGKSHQIEIDPKLTDCEKQTRLRRRFDRLFNRRIIVIQYQGTN
jgi:hypothetical protein